MNDSKYLRLIAFDPCMAGFGYIVLEGGTRLVDWGVAQVWSTAEAALMNRIEQFVHRYTPSLIVLEAEAGSRLGGVARRRIKAIARHCEERRIRVAYVSRVTVKEVFSEAGWKKSQIAAAIAVVFPELRCRLPRPRSHWRCEDLRMHIFDALSLALALPFSSKQ